MEWGDKREGEREGEEEGKKEGKQEGGPEVLLAAMLATPGSAKCLVFFASPPTPTSIVRARKRRGGRGVAANSCLAPLLSSRESAVRCLQARK